MANQIRIQGNRRGAHSVIGFVSHTTHDPATASAITHSAQMPSPGIGFVPHITHSPSAPPIGALRFERPLMESHSDRQAARLPRTAGNPDLAV